MKEASPPAPEPPPRRGSGRPDLVAPPPPVAIPVVVDHQPPPPVPPVLLVEPVVQAGPGEEVAAGVGVAPVDRADEPPPPLNQDVDQAGGVLQPDYGGPLGEQELLDEQEAEGEAQAGYQEEGNMLKIIKY